MCDPRGPIKIWDPLCKRLYPSVPASIPTKKKESSVFYFDLQILNIIREAAKNGIFLVARPLRPPSSLVATKVFPEFSFRASKNGIFFSGRDTKVLGFFSASHSQNCYLRLGRSGSCDLRTDSSLSWHGVE